MAEVTPSTPQAPGLPEMLATVMKWRDVPLPLTESDFNESVKELAAVVEAVQDQTDPLSRSTRALALMVLGNLHRDHGMLDHAMPIYDAALIRPADLDDGSPQGKHELANLFTNRGICILSLGDREKLPAALEDFDRAIDLRKDLPFDENAGYRWGLSAGWMNRGDVLNRIGGRDAEATAAYDEAISHLRQLPYKENAATLQRLALAWSNRGLTVADPAEARGCFDECIALLESPQNPQQLLTLCNATLNRGRHSLQVLDDATASAEDARRVLDLLSPHERSHPAPAEMAIQARHLLAHALCVWLDGKRQGAGLAEDWIGDATDAVEDALAIERHWEQQGVRQLRPLACELFQLGLHIYRVCQPHFLAEFIDETMDPELSPGAPFDDASFQAAAAHALRAGLNDAAERAAAASLDPEQAQKQQRIVSMLQATDQRLAELQQALRSAGIA